MTKTITFRTRLVVAACSGAAWLLALTPYGLWPLAIAAAAGLFRALEGLHKAWQRGAVGMLAGAVVFGASLRSIADFTLVGYLLLTLCMSLFIATATAMTGATWGGARLAATLVLAEGTRHRWPLGGLPLSGLELTQVNGPLATLAGIGGPLLVVAGVVGLGAMLHQVARRPTWRARRAPALALLVSVTVLPAVPAAAGTEPVGSLEIALVQGGGPRGIPAVRSTDLELFGRHLAATESITEPVDLVIWPEDVVDVDGTFTTSEQLATLTSLATRLDTHLLVGVTEDAEAEASGPDGVRSFRNRSVLISPDGALEGSYDKVHRVPFGEYVPARRWLDKVVDLSLIPREAVPGDAPGILSSDLGTLGVAISFEGLFAARMRAATQLGAQLLVNPTNGSSFRTDDVPAQQLAAARLRALESGRDVLVVGPTGPTAVVDADGKIRAQTELGTGDVVRSSATLREGKTPYSRLGDTPMLLAALAVLALSRWRTP